MTSLQRSMFKHLHLSGAWDWHGTILTKSHVLISLLRLG
jgi:hypothetical protein